MSPTPLPRHRAGSKAWHRARRNGIGASEIAAVLGLSPWVSPFTLHHIKTGAVDPDYADNPATYWGRRKEALIVAEWARRNRWATVKRTGSWAAAAEPWMTAAPDRNLYRDGQLEHLDSVLEAKTARYADGWGPDGSDEIPVHYRCQVMQQMHVMETPVAHVAVLIGSADFRTYEVAYDPAEALLLVDAGRAFWQAVHDRTPPPVDAADSTTQTLKRLHPDVDDTEITLPARLVADYRIALQTAQAAEQQKNAYTNEVLDLLGRARIALAPDGSKVATRSVSTPSRFDRAAFRKEFPDLEARFTVTGQPAVRLSPNLKELTK